MSLILASASPRRKELLGEIGLPFRIIVSDAEETVNPNDKPHDTAMSIAKQKASAVAASHPQDTVIGADTIVVLDDVILGKPKSTEDAARMLRMLSDKTHHVYTGVCICRGSECNCFFDKTAVTFRAMTDKEISDYIATGEPMDKAGAYGIQGLGGQFVCGIDGSLTNVIGLPVEKLKSVLSSLS